VTRLISTILLTFLISGCSILPWSGDDDSEILIFLSADQFNTWDLTAKFSVTSPEGTESGSVRWILGAEEERLDILSPTGAAVARLTVTGDQARLKTDGNEYTAPDAESLFKEALDLQFPVSAMRSWIRGLESPDLPLHSIKKDSEGRITTLVQNGWTVEYSGSLSIASGHYRYEVPRRLSASKDEFEIRWANTEWQIPVQ
jgi:outer membrane lipoprotein LolB